jgi:hypothetical protein
MHDEVLKLAYEVTHLTERNIDRIAAVMSQTKLLAINARIEAARAGAAGAGFGFLADEIGKVAGSITKIGEELRAAINNSTARLETAGTELLRSHKGTRFADLALNVIDIIDRNLWERSCNVRFWATDSAIVGALEHSGAGGIDAGQRRLGIIAKAYTVYIDVWICDHRGKVVACGKPQNYPHAIGTDVSQTDWFQTAFHSHSGAEFAVSDITRLPSLNHQAVATYAASIRAGGAPTGKALGVLAVLFDWAPKSAAIVKGVGLSESEKAITRILIVDKNHRVLAASDDRGLLEEIFPLQTQLTERFYLEGRKLTGFAPTPGYQTYPGLGWFGVLTSILPAIEKTNVDEITSSPQVAASRLAVS